MTVKELIEELQKFDEDLSIWFDYRADKCVVEQRENWDDEPVVLLW